MTYKRQSLKKRVVVPFAALTVSLHESDQINHSARALGALGGRTGHPAGLKIGPTGSPLVR